jgi:hypothetical protein
MRSFGNLLFSSLQVASCYYTDLFLSNKSVSSMTTSHWNTEDGLPTETYGISNIPQTVDDIQYDTFIIQCFYINFVPMSEYHDVAVYTRRRGRDPCISQLGNRWKLVLYF